MKFIICIDYAFVFCYNKLRKSEENMKNTKLRAEVSNALQLEQALDIPSFEFIYAPIHLLNNNIKDFSRIIAVPPVFLGNCEKETEKKLVELSQNGLRSALAHTTGHILMINRTGMNIHGGFRLNITNSVSQGFFEEREFVDTTLSIELTIDRLKKIKTNIPIGIIAYGHLPLMTVRRCPINDGKPCESERKCGEILYDRKGNSFQLSCSNAVEILNPDLLVLSDRLDDFSFIDFFTLKFTTEKNVSEIVDIYENAIKPEGKLTRGLYYRGSE